MHHKVLGYALETVEVVVEKCDIVAIEVEIFHGTDCF